MVYTIAVVHSTVLPRPLFIMNVHWIKVCAYHCVSEFNTVEGSGSLHSLCICVFCPWRLAPSFIRTKHFWQHFDLCSSLLKPYHKSLWIRFRFQVASEITFYSTNPKNDKTGEGEVWSWLLSWAFEFANYNGRQTWWIPRALNCIKSDWLDFFKNKNTLKLYYKSIWYAVLTVKEKTPPRFQ